MSFSPVSDFARSGEAAAASEFMMIFIYI